MDRYSIFWIRLRGQQGRFYLSWVSEWGGHCLLKGCCPLFEPRYKPSIQVMYKPHSYENKLVSLSHFNDESDINLVQHYTVISQCFSFRSCNQAKIQTYHVDKNNKNLASIDKPRHENEYENSVTGNSLSQKSLMPHIPYVIKNIGGPWQKFASGPPLNLHLLAPVHYECTLTDPRSAHMLRCTFKLFLLTVNIPPVSRPQRDPFLKRYRCVWCLTKSTVLILRKHTAPVIPSEPKLSEASVFLVLTVLCVLTDDVSSLSFSGGTVTRGNFILKTQTLLEICTGFVELRSLKPHVTL